MAGNANLEPQPKPPVRIEIGWTGEDGWTVRSGDRYEDYLTPDEALWCVVRIMTGTGTAYLRTPAEHAAWDAKYGPKKPLEAGEKQLPSAPSSQTEAAPGDRAKTEAH